MGRRNHLISPSVLVGYGTWDSWGLGFDYNNYSKSVTFYFVHWYLYFEFWVKTERLKDF